MNALKILATATVAGVLSLSVQAHNGVDHDGAYVEIDGLAVAGGAGTIDVSGALVFGGDEPFVAFEEAAGDALVPGLGLDLTRGTIEQAGSILIFTLDLTDASTGEVYPGALYNWDLGVTGAGEQRLFAWRSNLVQSALGGGAPTDWLFSIVTFQDGFLETPVTGQFTGSSVVWEVDIAQLGGRAGSRISTGSGPITSSQGGFGALQLTGFVDYDTATWSAGQFHVGGGVTLTLTGPGGFEETYEPRLRDGAFDYQIDELAPGAYSLTVTSKFADAEFEQVFPVAVA